MPTKKVQANISLTNLKLHAANIDYSYPVILGWYLGKASICTSQPREVNQFTKDADFGDEIFQFLTSLKYSNKTNQIASKMTILQLQLDGSDEVVGTAKLNIGQYARQLQEENAEVKRGVKLDFKDSQDKASGSYVLMDVTISFQDLLQEIQKSI